MRKLVTIRKVSELKPIPDADLIELAIVDGWQCVVKKGEFTPGDSGFYFEIDSFLPTDNPAFAFLKAKEGRRVVYNGIEGHRLRTIKLKKQLSQGLLLPLSIVDDHDKINAYVADEDDQWTEYFNIQKWESPLPAQLAGTVRSTFPSFIPKTDQERVQNYMGALTSRYINLPHETFEMTLKMDGSSMTVYKFDEDYGVCSRNLSLKETEENTFWQVARKQGLIDLLLNSAKNYALQGELCGPGIQDNIHKLNDSFFYLYDIYDIDEKRYLTPIERRTFSNMHSINHVKTLDANVNIVNSTIDTFLYLADLWTAVDGNQLEGIVFKSNIDPNFSFKVISNNYLLKEK